MIMDNNLTVISSRDLYANSWSYKWRTMKWKEHFDIIIYFIVRRISSNSCVFCIITWNCCIWTYWNISYYYSRVVFFVSWKKYSMVIKWWQQIIWVSKFLDNSIIRNDLSTSFHQVSLPSCRYTDLGYGTGIEMAISIPCLKFGPFATDPEQVTKIFN